MQIEHELIELMTFVNNHKQAKELYLQSYKETLSHFYKVLETHITKLMCKQITDLFMVVIDSETQQAKYPEFSYNSERLHPTVFLEEQLKESGGLNFSVEFQSKSCTNVKIRCRGVAHKLDAKLTVKLYPETTTNLVNVIYDQGSKLDKVYDYLVNRLTTMYQF
jgi:hypothetical protein